MALFSFGKKDKNPPEAAVPVAKAPPTPPKIQTPPASATIPAVKPPQPSGLIPASGLPAGTATTQPMVMPRGAAGLKPARPGVAQSSRSTQRIVLPSGTPGARPTSTTTKPLSVTAPTGRISLPIGMILRCLPPEVLASDLAEFEASGAAATEIGLPMNMILGQLPSGKVEMTLQDLIPHFPAGYLQPTESIASYLPNLINLPLMDVVMRIPPDLLALRPDQKGVDAAVINMADPFTEEILREQAEAARRASQANIIEESQVPQAEEFIPQAPVAKTIAPPPRPPSAALPMPRPSTTTTTGAMPQTSKLPPPPIPGAVPTAPAAPSLSARTISPSGQPLAPSRATSPVPIRPTASAATTIPIQVPPSTPSIPSVPTPPVPRHTTSLPVPPVPRQTGLVPPVTRQHTTSLQLPPRPSSTLPLPMMPTVPIPMPPSAPVSSAPPAVEPPSAPLPVGAPDAGADDLQRLAALAMAQMGENTESSQANEATQAVPPVPEPEPAAEPIASAPVEEPVPEVASEPEPVSAPPEEEPKPVSVPLPFAEEKVATVPIPAVVPVVEAPPLPPPPVPAPVVEPEPAPKPAFKFTPPPPAPAPVVEPAPAAGASGGVFNLNTCSLEELMQIPGCFRELAESIIEHRNKIGSFKRLEDLLDVPGMTKAAYTNLTGEAPPDNRIPLSLNELLGFPGEQHISLKDVTDRIACWPDVTGCVLSQSSGLSLVGTVPAGLDKAAIVAFAPRMFEAINKSFAEIVGKETDELTIPTSGTSFHIFRNKDLYLIILSRLPQMPERHMKVARFVLAALSIRRD